MFKTMLLSLLMGTTLFGGLLDFRTLEKAKEAYANEQYGEAAALYELIEDKNDDLHYNLGDAYYKQQKYEEALGEFEQVQKPELRSKALHNMGNAYAKTEKTDEAIAVYEEALQLGDDEDTKFNLELLKKQKEQQEKKENDQNQDDKDQEKKDDQQNSEDEQKKDQKPGEESDQEKEQKQSDSKSEQEKKEQEEREKQAKEDEKSKKDESEKEQGEMKQGEAKEEPISDMQERKYEKMLEKRGIKTLMVPLKTEGGPHEETTAW